MARDILSGFGPNSPQPQASSHCCGGVLPGDTKDVMNYKPPQGPKGIMNPQSPGLHGVNSGTTRQPTSAQTSGTPNTPGQTIRHCGSQGRY